MFFFYFSLSYFNYYSILTLYYEIVSDNVIKNSIFTYIFKN